MRGNWPSERQESVGDDVEINDKGITPEALMTWLNAALASIPETLRSTALVRGRSWDEGREIELYFEYLRPETAEERAWREQGDRQSVERERAEYERLRKKFGA